MTLSRSLASADRAGTELRQIDHRVFTVTRLTARCNCESSFCQHAHGCDRDATNGPWMDFVGTVCPSCAARTRETGGAHFLSRPPEMFAGVGGTDPLAFEADCGDPQTLAMLVAAHHDYPDPDADEGMWA
jgi:hypothetical protein